MLLAYASRRGNALLNRRLYIREQWFRDEYAVRRQECGVPDDLTFQTRNELSCSLLGPVLDEAKAPCQWIAMNDAFGRESALLDKINRKRKSYFAEIPSNTHVWRRWP